MTALLQRSFEALTLWLMLGGACSLYLATILLRRSRSPVAKYPLYTYRKWYDVLGFMERFNFIMNSPKILAAANEKMGEGQPYRIRDPWGEILVLPEEHLRYLKSNPGFTFEVFFLVGTHMQVATKVGPVSWTYPRFSNLVTRGVQQNLTQFSEEIINNLAEEIHPALQAILPRGHGWQEMALSDAMLAIIHRVSSRTFLGPDGPRNKEWLELLQDYVPDLAFANALLDLTPPPLRPIVQWLLPAMYKTRKRLAKARRLIASISEARGREEAANGKKRNDAIVWFDCTVASVGDSSLYDPAASQLALTFVGDNTTANFLMLTLLDLAHHPEVMEAVRREIKQETTKAGWTGWTRPRLQNLRLLDSVIKESLRFRPIFINAAILGGVVSELTLNDGTVLPAWTRVAIQGSRNHDPSVYDKPDEWDGYRYYNIRQVRDKEHMAQLVCATPENSTFGMGKHSCPGRFYAADLLKLLFCHLITRYDWAPANESEGPEMATYAWSQVVHPMARIKVRTRAAEQAE